MPNTTGAIAFYHAAENTLINLECRWEDEQAYEDIASYLQPFRSIAEQTGVTLLQMTARPFGVMFVADGVVRHARLRGDRYELVQLPKPEERLVRSHPTS